MSSSKSAPSISLEDFLKTVTAAAGQVDAFRPAGTFAHLPGKITLGLIIDTLGGATPQAADRPVSIGPIALSPEFQTLVDQADQWHGALVGKISAFMKQSADDQARETGRTLEDLLGKGLITQRDYDHISGLFGLVSSADKTLAEAVSFIAQQDAAALSLLGRVISGIGKDSLNTAIKATGAFHVASSTVKADISGAVQGASAGAAVGSTGGTAAGIAGAIIGGLIGGAAASVAALM